MRLSKERPKTPVIQTHVVTSTKEMADSAWEFLLECAPVFDSSFAQVLAAQMKHNSCYKGDTCRSEKVSSALFTVYEDKMFIECVTLPSAQWSLSTHEALQTTPDLKDRYWRKSNKMRSGHLGEIRAGSMIFRVVLLDSLFSRKGRALVSASQTEHEIVTTLLANNILPITSDGCPILPIGPRSA